MARLGKFDCDSHFKSFRNGELRVLCMGDSDATAFLKLCENNGVLWNSGALPTAYRRFDPRDVVFGASIDDSQCYMYHESLEDLDNDEDYVLFERIIPKQVKAEI